MTRKLLWPVLVIGALLIILPFAFQMPSRTAAGERMMSDFQPIMQPAAVAKTAYYYNQVFVPLGRVAPAINAATVNKFENYLLGFQALGKLNLPPALKAALPAMTRDFGTFMAMMKQGVPVFAQVPAGLAHYKPLVTTMQGNVNDFQSVNALPSFTLFTWFFVVPGILLVLISGYGLWYEHRESVRIHKAHPTPA